MKVKELIRQLKQYHPEARVYYGSHMGKGDEEILCIFKFAHGGDVIVEGASQFDVGEEVRAMLDMYCENGFDESEAYQEMVDRGYTPAVLREYLGKEEGDHMEAYCIEHGIS